MTARVTCQDGSCGNRSCRRCFMIERRKLIPNRPMWDSWTAAEDQHLCRVIGTAPLKDLADGWEAAGYLPRTALALRNRCFELDISTKLQGYSVETLAQALGVGPSTIHVWMECGYLAGRHLRGAGRSARYWIASSAVEAFIRTHGSWLVDLDRMPAGEPLRRLVEVAHRVDRWLTLENLAAYVGLAHVRHRLGDIPHRARPSRGKRPSRIMVRARDFPAIRDAIAAARASEFERRSLLARNNLRGLSRDAQGRIQRQEAA